MVFLTRAFEGRLRMLNWKSGDIYPPITQSKKSNLIESFKRLKESAKNVR
jgi:hypothetical protein